MSPTPPHPPPRANRNAIGLGELVEGGGNEVGQERVDGGRLGAVEPVVGRVHEETPVEVGPRQPCQRIYEGAKPEMRFVQSQRSPWARPYSPEAIQSSFENGETSNETMAQSMAFTS